MGVMRPDTAPLHVCHCYNYNNDYYWHHHPTRAREVGISAPLCR